MKNAMMDYIGIIGILVVMGVAWLFSENKKAINYKAIGIMLVLQVIVTWGMLSTQIGAIIINGVSAGILKLVDFAHAGIDFVVGGLKPKGVETVFIIDVLLPIVFFSAFMAVLTWIGILPWVIRVVGAVVSKITGLPKLESFNAVSSIFFGQSEALLAIRTHLEGLKRERLYMLCASAMGSVSSTIIGAYMTILPPTYVLVALPLNMFSALIIACILLPVHVESEKDVIKISNDRRRGLFEVIGEGASDGVKLVAIISGMLIAFIALMEGINFVTTNLTGLTLQNILGYILMPFAVISGVPVSEAVTAGGVMGTKIILNEFVAMLQFHDMIPKLSEKTVAVVSTYLVSFANFSSIGIIAGTFKAISEKQMPVVAGFGLKLLFGASLASFLTAAMTGLFI
jgi:nucleoside transport protein